VDNLTGKKPGRPGPNPDAERRKIGRVVHDDRGNASVDWRDAPADYDRPVLELLGEPGPGIKSNEPHDPYAYRAARSAGGGAGSAGAGNANRAGGSRGSGNRTDLRKLSQWIKMMRELEQRKREGGGEGESGG
jgi:hypothetical protein